MIPYSTDAPVYHWPLATVGLIVVNSAIFFATIGMDVEAVEPYMLVLGSGLHPLQWVTGNFLHGNIGHLVGNMIFLWAFGLVVEGKVGPLPFLAIYLGIGVGQSAIEQLLFLGLDAERYALGASGVIYGLLAICLVWAPRNAFQCFVGLRFLGGTMEIPILWFAPLYIGLEVLEVVKFGASPSGALAHLLGAVIGFPVGVGMLKANLVDCEDWDLFAVLGRREGRSARVDRKTRKAPVLAEDRAILQPSWEGGSKPKGKAKPKRRSAAEAPPADRAAAAWRKVRRVAEAGDPTVTRAAYVDARDRPGFEPAEAELLDLVKLLHAQGGQAESIPVMRDYCRRFPEHSARMALKLAQVLLKGDRPASAARVLAEIPDGTLPPNLDTLRRQLSDRAEQLQAEGVLELEGDD